VANTLKISVENADELLLAGVYGAGALIRIQSSATEGGVYANLSGTGSTPTIALVAGTSIYTGQDPSGTSSTWYKTRFENAGGTLTSDYSAAFQVAPEGSGLLASLHDLRQRLEIPYTDTEQDENLIEWLTQATAFIHTYTGRRFTPDGATTYTADGHDAVRGGRCLLFPKGIRSLTMLEVADQTGGDFTEVESGHYFLRPSEAARTPGWPFTQVWLSDVGSAFFAPGYANVRLTGAFGWAAIPADISAIALNLAVAAARERGAGGGDIVTIGIGGERSFERALSFKDKMNLDFYRVRHVA
jgi:hypothetical protein